MSILNELRGFRHNRAAQAVAVSVVLALFFTFIVIPLNNSSKSMDGKIEKARHDLKEITMLADEYTKLSAILPGRTPSKKAAGSMSGELERLARELGIEKNIKRMTPKLDASRKKQEELALTVTNLPLPVFVDLLEKLHESPAAIKVRRARIKSGFEKPENLEVELTLTPAVL
jgi:type II secretory pathway component PulM